MLTFLLALSVGAYASRRVSTDHDGEAVGAKVDYAAIWNDFKALCALIGFVYGWSVATGRNTRTYVDNALLPWLEERGISIQIPSIELPALPQSLEVLEAKQVK
jgi:hypothetical protein